MANNIATSIIIVLCTLLQMSSVCSVSFKVGKSIFFSSFSLCINIKKCVFRFNSSDYTELTVVIEIWYFSYVFDFNMLIAKIVFVVAGIILQDNNIPESISKLLDDVRHFFVSTATTYNTTIRFAIRNITEHNVVHAVASGKNMFSHLD